MDEPTSKESIESISSDAAGGTQVKVDVDDTSAPVSYSSTVRVSGTAEEFTLDFAGQLRPAGQNRATLKIDNRVVLSPWAAKRLAMTLGQAVQRYEQAYGKLELDPRKRLRVPPPTDGDVSSN